jgi:thymidylate synthase (FAD)
MIKATYIDHMGSDLSVVNAARVSFGKVSDWNEPSMGKASGLSDRDAKLVRYLAVHKHISPFGHGLFVLGMSKLLFSWPVS